jgi:hypothetical protein
VGRRGRFVTERSGRIEHIRVRPSWDCAACGQPWPCPNAKEDMLREFGEFHSVLTIFMATQMYEAFDDLTAHGAVAPPELYERFLSWIHQPPEER